MAKTNPLTIQDKQMKKAMEAVDELRNHPSHETIRALERIALYADLRRVEMEGVVESASRLAGAELQQDHQAQQS